MLWWHFFVEGEHPSPSVGPPDRHPSRFFPKHTALGKKGAKANLHEALVEFGDPLVSQILQKGLQGRGIRRRQPRRASQKMGGGKMVEAPVNHTPSTPGKLGGPAE